MKVLLTIEFSAEQVAELRALSPSIEIESHPLPPDTEAQAELWKDVEVLYTFRALPAPEQAPNLRWIQFHLAGIEEHLEEAILHQQGVQATTLSGANAPQVAEHALALILSLAHHVNKMIIDQGQRKWATKRSDTYQPAELIGSTVGIVGYGSVGQRLARLLQTFGVNILATKRDILNSRSSDFVVDGQSDPAASLVRRLYPAKALRSMFKECDFVVITVPLTPGTRGMIGVKQLEGLKTSAFLIDVSRGGVVDHVALAQALKKNLFAGAALDVFPEEPLAVDSPLWDQQNVIISPHVAGLSAHYTERAFTLFKENLRRYIGGEELLNKIDLERGY